MYNIITYQFDMDTIHIFEHMIESWNLDLSLYKAISWDHFILVDNSDNEKIYEIGDTEWIVLIFDAKSKKIKNMEIHGYITPDDISNALAKATALAKAN